MEIEINSDSKIENTINSMIKYLRYLAKHSGKEKAMGVLNKIRDVNSLPEDLYKGLVKAIENPKLEVIIKLKR